MLQIFFSKEKNNLKHYSMPHGGKVVTCLLTLPHKLNIEGLMTFTLSLSLENEDDEKGFMKIYSI